VAKIKLIVGQHVRISKEKMKFAKGGEQTYSTEIFRITKDIERKLEDLNKTPIEGQFYSEDLTPVRISKETTYKINKVLDKRERRNIRDYLVQWKGCSKYFDSWMPAYNVKDI